MPSEATSLIRGVVESRASCHDNQMSDAVILSDIDSARCGTRLGILSEREFSVWLLNSNETSSGLTYHLGIDADSCSGSESNFLSSVNISRLISPWMYQFHKLNLGGSYRPCKL